jgi:hypothetical protein
MNDEGVVMKIDVGVGIRELHISTYSDPVELSRSFVR